MPPAIGQGKQAHAVLTDLLMALVVQSLLFVLEAGCAEDPGARLLVHGRASRL